jgi:plastocyanin
MRARLTALLVAHAILGAAPLTHAQQLRAMVSDGNGKPLPDALVLAAPASGRTVPGQPTVDVVDQVDKEFVPYVKPLRIGSQVRFPNKDDIQHHVYSFSPAKKFELPLYRGTPAQPVLFDKAGVVKLGCNIHDWMVAYLYVTDAPHFGKTGGTGQAELDGLAQGRYRVWVWHPRMIGTEADTAREIDLPATGSASMAWKLKLRPEFRPLRAPLPSDAGYR